MAYAGWFTPIARIERRSAILEAEIAAQATEADRLEDLNVQVVRATEAAQAVAATVESSAEGLSPEGGNMASTETMQTMRATGGFTLPTGLKSFLPLILAFILVVFIILKK